MYPEKPIYILGISAFYHDSAACLMKDGEIIAAAQEERFTRKKHDFVFPKNSIEYCLKEAGVSAADLSYVGFYDKPFLKFERILLTYLTYAPFGIRSFLKSIPIWLKEKLYLKDLIREELRFRGEIIFTEHHESHAASAFFPSPYEQAAILTIDGVGEWATTTYGIGTGNKIELLGEILFPHSLGLLYSAFTYYTGFRVNSGEYKLMGLAPYGAPKYVDLIKDNLIDIKADGSFKLNMKYFDYCSGLTMTNNMFNKLFGGKPRKPESPITEREMDIAHSIQDVTEEIMLKMADHVHKETGKDNLCLAGGVALNCVGNGKILRHSKFKDIWIQPAAGDAGGALGAAQFIWYQYLDNHRDTDNKKDKQKGSYLGPSYLNEDIKSFMEEKGVPFEEYEDGILAPRVAKLIAEENVVGFFQDRMEFGPRALGSRSIMGDARSQKMQSIMNLKIKFRESFRPFAPTILEEKVSEFFDIDRASPYMLLVAPVSEDKIDPESKKIDAQGIDKLKIIRSVVPAITHVDYSARIQTISQEYNALFYKTVKAFYDLTGCPVVINTSFNIRGEPIVCTPEDAYKCFMCTDMDYLVLNNFILEKKKQPEKYKVKKQDISLVLD